MTAPSLLLDTCILIWGANDAPLEPNAEMAFDAAREAGKGIYYSPISAWEIGLLVSRGRLKMLESPVDWFRQATQKYGLMPAPLTDQILIETSFLPEPLHRDPADRIIIATARALGHTILTRDRLILDYANEGHVRALAC